MRKDLEFTDRIIDDTVYMLLNEQIGYDSEAPDAPYINGSSFANEMLYWKSSGYNVVVKINTPGGNVMDGWSMIDAIQTCEADTQNVGLAASMGGICLLFGKNRSARDYSTCMIHAPKGGNKAYLEIIRAQFKDLLTTRTKFTTEEINDMMDSGKDYFFDASQMLEKGIVDKIEKSPVKVSRPEKATAKEYFDVYNSILKTETKKDTEMEIFNKIFGGKDDSESVGKALEMKAENSALAAKAKAQEYEIKALKEKIEAYEEKIGAYEKAANEIDAKALVESAVKDGKIAESAKEVFAKFASENYEAAKAMVEGIKKPVGYVAPALDAKDNQDKNEKNTFAWLSKNNPKELARLKAQEPEVFNKLFEEYTEATKLESIED